MLPVGRLREEVLANVARQIDELRDYFAAFNDSLTDRCRRVDYSDQARLPRPPGSGSGRPPLRG